MWMISDHYVMIRVVSMEISLCPMFGHPVGFKKRSEGPCGGQREKYPCDTPTASVNQKKYFLIFPKLLWAPNQLLNFFITQKNYRTHQKGNLNLYIWISHDHYIHHIELLQGPLRQLWRFPLSGNEITVDLRTAICITTNICSALFYRLSSQITTSPFHQQFSHCFGLGLIFCFVLFCFFALT